MAYRVDEHSEARLSLGRNPASTECHHSTLRLIDIVHPNVEVQLLWVLWIRPTRRHPRRHPLKSQLTGAQSKTDDHPVVAVLVDLHAQHICVERRKCPRVRAVEHRGGRVWAESPNCKGAPRSRCAPPKSPNTQPKPGRLDNIHFLVHPVRVVVPQVADELVPPRRQRDGGPADRARGDALACPGGARA